MRSFSFNFILSAAAASATRIDVLHLAERFAVVAKPAGTVVHRNKFSRRGEVALLQMVRDQMGRYVNPVHRLDGGTSGALIFAFDSESAAMLQAAMSAPDALKEYLVFTRGDASHLGEDHIEERPLKCDKGVLRNASTSLTCVASFDDGTNLRSSLLLARPRTGRWHQIRKHLNGLSHPVLGDAKHGESRMNRWWRDERGMRHLGLHCSRIRLTLDDGSLLDVRCPVRDDLIELWRTLPWWEAAAARLPYLADDEAAWRTRLELEQESRVDGLDGGLDQCAGSPS